MAVVPSALQGGGVSCVCCRRRDATYATCACAHTRAGSACVHTHAHPCWFSQNPVSPLWSHTIAWDIAAAHAAVSNTLFSLSCSCQDCASEKQNRALRRSQLSLPFAHQFALTPSATCHVWQSMARNGTLLGSLDGSTHSSDHSLSN